MVKYLDGQCVDRHLRTGMSRRALKLVYGLFLEKIQQQISFRE